jgi:hypothetical protein
VRAADLPDDEVRQFWMRKHGDRAEDLATIPVSNLRGLLTDAEANLIELVALGFLSAEEAAEDCTMTIAEIVEAAGIGAAGKPRPSR